MKTLQKFALAVICLTLISVSTKSHLFAQGGFGISGKVVNPKEGVKILLRQMDLEKFAQKPVDTISLKADGSFAANFPKAEAGLYQLSYEKKRIALALEKGQKVVITFDAGKEQTEFITKGSPDTDEYRAYNSKEKEISKKYMAGINQEFEELYKKMDEEAKVNNSEESKKAI